MPDVSAKPVIFISFSHKDEPEKPGSDEVAWLTFVQSFLAPVVKTGIFDIWVDEHLHGGDVIDAEIMKKLAECDIFVLLASRHSLASTYVVETEIKTIRQRQNDGGDVHMFPIVLSPIPNAALKQLKDLLLSPKDGKPLSLMSKNDREVAMAGIADDIAEVAEQIASRKAAIRAEAPTVLERMHTFDVIAKEAPGAAPQVYVDTTHLPETPYERLVGREVQLKCLDDAWAGRDTNIISLIAEGGAGKSALVNEWLKGMRADRYRGAETVLGWSFYSQGTKERATSAEQFLSWTIEKLSIKIETTSTTAKGEAIAEALTSRRVLLVLDGCEPLQHGLDKQQGELKDQGLRALLRRFASASPDEVHGLVVLTSRLAVKDIARWKDGSAPVEPVDELSDEAGVALLRDNGVWGVERELRAAVRDFGGHPLALSLLASFLKKKHFGDVRQRDRIRGLLRDEENPRHDHAQRVMESYEKEWLTTEPVEHAIMCMVGLFDRPASDDCLRALRQTPPIAGLTNAIVDLDEDEWWRAIVRLRNAKLLLPLDVSARGALDAHPLVREWFGERLRKANDAAWKMAHGRLYEHLRDNTKEGLKPTLEDIAPLYQAIAHGCRAGRFRETLKDIYVLRICKSESSSRFYSKFVLGAFGSDLAAISWFFERPYDLPASAFQERDHLWLFSEAAAGLRAQGRIEESLSAMRSALNLCEHFEIWRAAASMASNISQIELRIGNIKKAIASIKLAAQYSERAEHWTQRNSIMMLYGEVLIAAGRSVEAINRFRDANKMGPTYSVPDYWYRNYLISTGGSATAIDRVRAARESGYASSILGDAFDHLTLARAQLSLAFSSLPKMKERSGLSQFDECVDKFRASGQIEFMPISLLARASFRRVIGDWKGTARDLEEVEEIAETGSMRLYLCDLALERARLTFANTESFAPLNGLVDQSPPKAIAPDATEAARLKEQATNQLAIAADYITTCGYHRRDEELAELQAVMRGERKFADLPPRV